MDPLGFEILLAALRIGPKRIAAVDDDIAGLQKRDELLNDRIHRRSRLDHDLRFPRTLERSDKFLQGFGGDELFAFATSLRKLLGYRRGPIIDGNGETLALHVENEVFAHYGKANQADITGGGHEILRFKI